MWDEVPEGSALYSSAVKRETELKSTEGYWGWMKNRGSRTQRCTDTRASALSILSGLLTVSDSQGPVVFQLQHEIVEEHMGFDETAAGTVLNNHYATRWDRLQGELRALQKPLLKIGSSASESKQQVQEQRQDLERQITAVETGERYLRQTVEAHFADKTKRHRARFNHTQDEISKLSSEIERLRSELESLKEVSSRFTQSFDPQSRDSMRNPPEVASYQPRGMSGRRDPNSSSYTYERSSFDVSDSSRGLQDGRAQQRNRLQRTKKPQYSMEIMSNEERKIFLERELARQEKRKIMKRNTLAFLGMLGGVATIAAGAATLQIPVVAAGIALFGTAGMKLDLHKKKRKKPEEDREWVVSEHD
ncbi:hypothetical protein ACKAV7_013519 [Fusarium commune]|nr:hypothetical protein LZL87_006295 [Fusarium oxysporum]